MILKQKARELTQSARIQSPNWGTNEYIVAIKYESGTQNLVTFHPDSTEHLKTITSFSDAETIFSPCGILTEKISTFHMRILDKKHKKINLKSGVISDVLADNFTDYRDPFITENGRYLLYAANHKGQFNVYRKDLETHKTKKLTSVVGGAFMPHQIGSTLYFSEYETDGYKLKKQILNASDVVDFEEPKLPNLYMDTEVTLNNYNDKDIDAFDDYAKNVSRYWII